MRRPRIVQAGTQEAAHEVEFNTMRLAEAVVAGDQRRPDERLPATDEPETEGPDEETASKGRGSRTMPCRALLRRALLPWPSSPRFRQFLVGR